MMKLALFLAALFLIVFYKIYSDYEGNKKKFILDLGLLFFLLFATGFSKYIRVYLLLLVVHIILLLTSWGAYIAYLYGKEKKTFLIFSPLISIIIFFLLGYFVSHS
ncbi:hypothetical protein NitYY0826_C0864 [Nitratiruptor sp. YY08-26]|nr:hypothetical protein NitYY0813_C0862 [Nitratiruptor sp. YY08-13]BCD65932.1 hypothetical protein NitYY0826_C0864 [Nitratiruptor sp. YY08-26]